MQLIRKQKAVTAGVTSDSAVGGGLSFGSAAYPYGREVSLNSHWRRQSAAKAGAGYINRPGPRRAFFAFGAVVLLGVSACGTTAISGNPTAVADMQTGSSSNGTAPPANSPSSIPPPSGGTTTPSPTSTTEVRPNSSFTSEQQKIANLNLNEVSEYVTSDSVASIVERLNENITYIDEVSGMDKSIYERDYGKRHVSTTDALRATFVQENDNYTVFQNIVDGLKTVAFQRGTSNNSPTTPYVSSQMTTNISNFSFAEPTSPDSATVDCTVVFHQYIGPATPQHPYGTLYKEVLDETLTLRTSPVTFTDGTTKRIALVSGRTVHHYNKITPDGDVPEAAHNGN